MALLGGITALHVLGLPGAAGRTLRRAIIDRRRDRGVRPAQQSDHRR